MSERTTTASTTHSLLKYSKSSGANDQASEWEHFTNPTIKSVLDVQKSSTGDFTLFRLRIMWVMSKEHNSMVTNGQEVTFEDLDMLSFSSLLSSHVQTAHAHGLPLRAVYRDNTVGIRYLHPLMDQQNVSPSFRRFQLTFESRKAAEQFVDAIKFVCPCKLHEPARSTTIRTPTTRTQTLAPPQTVHTPIRSPLSTITPESRVSTAPSSPLNRQSSSSVHLSSFSSPAATSGLHLPFSSPAASSPRPSAAANAPPPSSPLNPHGAAAPLHQDLSLPSSSQPYVTSDPSSMPPPAAPSRKSSEINSNPTDTSGSLFDSLQDLCQLPRSELEQLVAQIVNDESFPELLEKLDGLWRVKGALERRP